MKRYIALTLLAAAVLSACSGIPRRESDAQTLARYQAYAGAPVSEFRMYGSFDGWTPVDADHVVINTNVNESYLITVAQPCVDLPFVTRLGVVSKFPHTVSSGFDSLRVGRDTCRIQEIRPVDARQMKADLADEIKARG